MPTKRKPRKPRTTPPKPPIRREVLSKHRRARYAKLVAAGKTGQQAVIETAPSPVKPQGAAVTAARWNQDPAIKAAIAAAQQEALDYLQIDVNCYLEQLHAIATFDPETCYDAQGKLLAIAKMPARTRMAIAGMDVVAMNLKAGDGVVDEVAKIKVVPKIEALALMLKVRGLIVQRKETGKPGDFDKLDEHQTLKKLEELAPKVGLRLVKTG